MEIGYFLSSEEHAPGCLVRQARLAEDVGIERVWISDHFHPWLDEQDHSPFVWSVIGAIGATTSLHVGTAVTCPTVRIHPAIIAQAAATSALLLDGRFELGVGSGEALNEHIFGDRWPPAEIRLEMLDEAVEVIRGLWGGEVFDHRGRHYVVENARLYSLPSVPTPIMVSAFAPKAAQLAARIGDGLVTTSPDKETVDQYRAAATAVPATARVDEIAPEPEAEVAEELRSSPSLLPNEPERRSWTLTKRKSLSRKPLPSAQRPQRPLGRHRRLRS